MKKHIRQACDRIQSMGVACTVVPSSGHQKLSVTKDGVTLEVPISCTPTDPAACINMVVQMMRRRFAERGVTI